MKRYSGWEYLLIDLANLAGLDTKLFGQRIQWAEENLHHMETLVSTVKKKNQAGYLKTCMTIRKALRGEVTGHMVELDAVCSGVQMMSALTGCIVGATNTGLVDPNVRADAYTTLTVTMRTMLSEAFEVIRDDAKTAFMCHTYGSKAEPKKIFGEDTPELEVFYEAVPRVAPGAAALLDALLNAWNPWAKKHHWIMPDGFNAVVKVMSEKESRIEVDELDGASFTYKYYINEGTEAGLSLAANVVHSSDAYLVRTMHRRCNYNRVMVEEAQAKMLAEMVYRNKISDADSVAEPAIQVYINHYNRSTMADVVILPYIVQYGCDGMSSKHIEKLLAIVETMLAHKPFPLVTIHDAFKARPNDCNHVRQHYINIFAEIAESELLSDLLSQLHGITGGKAKKLSSNLAELIRGCEYPIC